ncbi:beta-1,3-galactosyltransferase brn [Anoplophora glabripennis]|uniref:beta-1,3-galactosyltransferase brn n=1 Tax=Anoplophora glabripennis TaxID=217634 RepID=UPI0008753BA9|nr:beta-1,3-galactosyltransferase brn [Anoplophora glabripennis]
MIYSTHRRLKRALIILIILSLLYLFGIFHHAFESDFYNDFHYPYDGDIEMFIQKLKKDVTPDMKPINSYHFQYYKNCSKKCTDVQNLRLVYLIKSDPHNFYRRIIIRKSWGYERRFADIEIRTVFLIGLRESESLQKLIDEENRKFSDIVQANFSDTYYNNTYKTMMGMQWVIKFCPDSKFYLFADDDYYISTKNVLRFLRFPTKYPQYLKEPMANVESSLARYSRQSDDVKLYTGYVFKSAPLRNYFSKWYVSLQEYPYHMWPPYVTAGAFILSRSALTDMYYSSFYTQHFRFDDIYVGLLAYKAKIEPLHCDEFHFYRKAYNKLNFEYTIASHGYGDPEELVTIWAEQNSLGNA